MSLLNNSEKIQELISFQHKNPSFCEKLLSLLYSNMLKPGDSFIDVGARVGHHLFPMSRLVTKSGRGIGIEANAEVAKGLVDRVEVNPNFKDSIHIVSGAAADKTGTAKFYIRQDFQGWSSLYESHVHPAETMKVQEEEVALLRIDDIVFKDVKLDKCKFIKLDIENAEFIALRGAEKTLKKLKPIVVFENSPRNAARLNDYSLQEFLDFFKKLNYKLYDIYLNEVTMERLTSSDLLPSYYFACPKNFKVTSPSFFDQYEAGCLDVMKEMSSK